MCRRNYTSLRGLAEANENIHQEFGCDCSPVLPIVEQSLEKIDKKKFNLSKRFDHWNEKLFDNRLKLDKGVSFGKTSKGSSGVFKGMYKKKGKLTITEIWDTEIVISDKKDYTEETLDMILLHEMIHAYFGIIERRDVGHNIEFKVKAKEISNTVGFEVPLTDNVTEISSAIKAKKVGCILFEFGSRTNVMFASENTYNKHIAKFLIDTLPKYSFPADLKITHGMCETNLTEVYPLVRSFNKVKLYRLEEQNEDKIKWLEAKEFYFGDEYNR